MALLQPHPEDWAMNSVSDMLEWKAQGRAEGFAEGMAAGMQEARRSDLLKILRMRFPDIASEVTIGIRGMKDLDQLTRWLEVALTAPTVEMFRAMAQDADGRAGLRTR
jgi:hypothetical protein